MIKRIGLSLFLLGLTASAHAVHVGEVTTIFESDQDVISKEIKNPTESARLITVNVIRISSPMDNGKVIPSANKDELLFTPANLILMGNASENIRFFYKGPKDDQERYYRIQWTDRAVTEDESVKSSKKAAATTSAVINTILVVSPRKENFQYEYKDGIVYNRGNVSFRVSGFGPCKKANQKEPTCRERYHVMPGRGVKLGVIDFSNKKAHVGVWHGQQYITIK